MPAQFVKAFRKSNKNDYLDAEAIAEAVQRPTMRFVPIKTDDQLDLQALHRVRDRWVARRTAVMNQIRGFLMERGITIRKGPSHLTTQLQGVMEDANSLLSGRLRLLILELKHEWDELDTRRATLTIALVQNIGQARLNVVGKLFAKPVCRSFRIQQDL
jgi:transposase